MRNEGTPNPPAPLPHPKPQTIADHTLWITSEARGKFPDRWIVVYGFEQAGLNPARASRRFSEEAEALRVDAVSPTVFRVSFDSRNLKRIVTVAVEEGGELMDPDVGKRF